MRIYVATFDKELYEKGYATLNDETLDILEYNDTYIKGTINVKEDGVMWTSVPYEIGGWKLFVDGNEQEMTPLCNAFIGALMKPGEHTVELKYQSPGFVGGIIVTSVSLCAFIAVLVIEMLKKKRKIKKEL